jgi:hypothetical protein
MALGWAGVGAGAESWATEAQQKRRKAEKQARIRVIRSTNSYLIMIALQMIAVGLGKRAEREQ